MKKTIIRNVTYSSCIEEVPMPGRYIRESKKERDERNSNFDWMASQNLSDYRGHWVCIVNKRIIAHGRVLKDVLKITREKYPDKVPFVVRVPEMINITV